MAKRKRLSPAAILPAADGSDGALETKAHNGWVGVRPRPPIADQSGDAATRAALDEVTTELQSARSEGRMVIQVPLEALEVGHLVRDRVAMDPEELAALQESLAARGQQTPVDVVDLGQGRYGLISGLRRVTALRALGHSHALALLRAPEGAAEAYTAMVEENEIRAGLSFYERARIVVQAVAQGVFPDTHAAIRGLFATARRPKQSKIAAFTTLVQQLDDVLRFPTAIPEKLGLALVAALQGQIRFRHQLIRDLAEADPQDAAAERAVLEAALRAQAPARSRPPKPAAEAVAPGVALSASRGKLVLSGPGVDPGLIEDLRAWLTSR